MGKIKSFEIKGERCGITGNNFDWSDLFFKNIKNQLTESIITNKVDMSLFTLDKQQGRDFYDVTYDKLYLGFIELHLKGDYQKGVFESYI